MNLILFEKNEDYEDIIRESIDKRSCKLAYFQNCPFDLTVFDKIFLFVIIQNNFVDYELQKFILAHKEKIDVITISKKKPMSEPFISWLNSLVKYNKYMYNICSRLEFSTLKNDLVLVNGIINSNRVPKTMESVTAYTDGACSGNPGPGGWGVVLICGDSRKEVSGYEEMTTNNRMELTAAVKALSMLKKRCNVDLYSDSAYVVNAINQNWLLGWKNNGWKNSDKEQVKNIELWQELDSLISFHSVKFFKVKGHADVELNNRCDELATNEIAKHK